MNGEHVYIVNNPIHNYLPSLGNNTAAFYRTLASRSVLALSNYQAPAQNLVDAFQAWVCL